MAKTGVIQRMKQAMGGDRVEAANRRLEEQRALVALRRQECEDAQQAVTDAQVRRTAEAEADDERLDELDEAIAAAERSVIRSADRLKIAEARLVEAEEIAKKAAASDAEAKVDEMIADGAPGLVERYAALCRDVLNFLQDIAAMEARLQEMARAGGIDCNRSIESAARTRGWLATEETVSTEIVTLWVDRTGTIVSPQPSAKEIKLDGAGYYLEAPAGVVNMGRSWNANSQMEIRKKRFRNEVVLERVPTAGYIEAWASKLVLPGLGAGHSAIFSSDSGSEQAIGAALAQLDHQLAELRDRTDDRRPVTRTSPVIERVEEAA